MVWVNLPGSRTHKPESATIGGIYLALNNASPVSTKSPYIYNCTSFGNGATGAVLDGSVHAEETAVCYFILILLFIVTD